MNMTSVWHVSFDFCRKVEHISDLSGECAESKDFRNDFRASCRSFFF